METTLCLQDRYCHNSFKSYYVVWKLRWVSGAKTKKGCLNRTMQYGNFQMVCFRASIFALFKSYYVVWKLSEKPQVVRYMEQFKSYYVVWKPAITFPITTQLLSFKSYYVVWKQLLVFFNIICVSRFKSYYVVWKLLFLFFILDVSHIV